MRLRLCSPSHLLAFAAGLALGLILTSDIFSQEQTDCGEGHDLNQPAAAMVAAGGEDIESLKAFLYPPDEEIIVNYKQMKKKAYRPGSRKEPKYLREEYSFKKQLFVGVLTQQSYLRTRAKTVYETWGKEVDKLVFFVGEDCSVPADLSYLPVVKLKGIPDNVYPPLRKAFAVMSYMYDHYVNQFDWFIRADDDMYVRTRKLSDLLSRMNPYESVYLGRAGTGRREDLNRLRLLAHERYCMGGPGIILSGEAMRKVGPHLGSCVAAVLYHDEQHPEADWNDDDVEIGRCLSRKIDIQCSSSFESRKYFIFDYDGDTLNPLSLWTNLDLRELITVHPVKQSDNMRSIHHFFTTLEFRSHYEELHGLVSYLNDLCKTLPPHVTPPKSISAGCNLTLQPQLANDSLMFNYLGTAPGNYLFTQTYVPYVHNPRDKFDLSPWIRFNNSLVQDISGVSPQYAPPSSLKLEVTHVLNLLEPYITSQHTPGSRITSIVDGYTRFNPHLGREYLLSLRVSRQKRIDFRRFHVIRELEPRLSVIEEPLGSLSSPTVHVILPVDKVDETLRGFMTSYAQSALKHIENKLHLVVVVFSESLAEAVEEEIKKVSETSNPVAVTIAVGEGSFNRLKALDIGMASLKGGASLAFLADTEVRFGRSFFIRCRSNAVLGERVYFPVAFWLYHSKHMSINRWSGLWASYNFWLVCIHKQDYDVIGGYHGSKYSVELFEKVSKSHLEVMQSPDPGLYHLWGQRSCRELKSNSRREACLKMKKNSLVDKVELSDYLGEMAGEKNSFEFDDRGT